MQYNRQLTKTIKKFNKSILLLGPRQTGKSTLIAGLNPDVTINLADEKTYLDFLRDPTLLAKILRGHRQIFIDEVQRIPSLLNTVQALIDRDKTLRFYLTGSSARKLKRGQANLLPGRVLTYQIGPLSVSEIGQDFNVDRILSVGALPGIFAEPNKELAQKILRSYSATYLREEVQAEALTRNLEGFSRFFDVIASRSGDFLDVTKFSSQAMIDRTSARRYFDVLVDTLILEPVPAFTKSSKRRLVQHPRYYFFDVGVLNGVLANFDVSADRRGNLFEHLCLQMITSEAKGRDEEIRISVYRTEAGAEVDFIVEKGKMVFAIEVKATKTIGSHDLTGLKSFRDFYGKKAQYLIFYLGERHQEVDGVQILPLHLGIRAVFEG